MIFNWKTLSLASLSAIALIAAPLAMTHLAQAQDAGQGPGGMRGRGGHHFEQLNLTEAQSTQIEAIRADAHSQMQAILTPQQQAAVGDEGPRGWRDLDLSEEQRSQIQTIREASKERIDAVLTDEQRQQLEQMHQQREERRSDRMGSRQAAR
jgi:periplasmic protein CpxP/Spy